MTNRRQFLKTSALATTCMGIPSLFRGDVRYRMLLDYHYGGRHFRITLPISDVLLVPNVHMVVLKTKLDGKVVFRHQIHPRISFKVPYPKQEKQEGLSRTVYVYYNESMWYHDYYEGFPKPSLTFFRRVNGFEESIHIDLPDHCFWHDHRFEMRGENRKLFIFEKTNDRSQNDERVEAILRLANFLGVEV